VEEEPADPCHGREYAVLELFVNLTVALSVWL
jgi:hypothetical protein